jgi:hypothetical protein
MLWMGKGRRIGVLHVSADIEILMGTPWNPGCGQNVKETVGV